MPPSPPQAEHIYTKGSAVTAEELARATVIFGWPKPECLAEAKSLRWFQTMWAGTDEYEPEGILPPGVILSSSSGSNSLSVAEHMLAEVYERLLERYAASPQQRYEALLERCPDLLQMVSLRELASYLGVRPETLSRIRGRIR